VDAPAVGRIRERATFRALRQPARRASSGPVRAAFVPVTPTGEVAFPQVAFAIGRRTGNAVVRNRLRRRLRSAVRDVARDSAPGAYLLGAERAAMDVSYQELVRAVGQAMGRAGAGRGTNTGTP